jgi:hypothetical protein
MVCTILFSSWIFESRPSGQVGERRNKRELDGGKPTYLHAIVQRNVSSPRCPLERVPRPIDHVEQHSLGSKSDLPFRKLTR